MAGSHFVEIQSNFKVRVIFKVNLTHEGTDIINFCRNFVKF